PAAATERATLACATSPIQDGDQTRCIVRATVVAPYFFQSHVSPRDLHSFPTRRSSDLSRASALGSTCPGTSPTSSGSASGRSSRDRKSTRLNSSHVETSYAVFCLKKKT